MKGYLLLAAAVAVLLLLIPLPALPHGERPNAPGSSDAAPLPDGTDSPAPSRTDDPAREDAVFRVLCADGQTVETLSEREFLIRTLAFEMPPTYHAQALRAQAVAAYTYYGRRRAAQREKPDAALKGADFAAPGKDFPAAYAPQALKERWGAQYEAYLNKLCAAVDDVAGKRVLCGGQPIDACFFACSAGSTEAAAVVWGSAVSYLVPVASPGDRLCPTLTSTVTLTAAQVRQALAAEDGIALPDDPAAWFAAPERSAAGTVAEQSVGGKALTGTRLRALFGLRSACFTVAYADGTFTFTVQGYGHMVGMSQYGADYLARQGFSYDEILRYYYTGTTVE